MKLYYSPGACSLSPHIVLREAGYKFGSEFNLEKVDIRSKKTESGKEYQAICAKGAVPALELPNGEILTEGPAIVQYLADQKPEANLAPKNGTMERVRLQEWLNYISTDIHKSFTPLFQPQYGSQAVDAAKAKLEKQFSYLADQLKGKNYLMGDNFTVADAYLFAILGWVPVVKMDLSSWPVLVEYQKRIAARPHVQEAMKAEGLLDQKAA